MRRLLAIAAALLLLASQAQAASITLQFPVYEGELVNPFIGNVAWASDDPSSIGQPFTLVYANLRWADVEPEEGVYDFTSLETDNQLDLWRESGKRLILRFVMDLPGQTKHQDIPGWLAKKTGGQAYSTPYGKGYCPDYADPALIEAHGRVLAAIAGHFAGDGLLCCVELGSLGHWGEWHVHEKAGSMPDASVRRQYVAQYRAAFPHTMLLMRRPFAEARDYGTGLYNDTAGSQEPTMSWLKWISDGGVYDQTGEENALVPMPNAWQTAMIGGELATDLTLSQLLLDQPDTTLALLTASHASWIGPHSFASGVQRGGSVQAALDTLMRHIGYRLRVASATLSDSHTLTLRWTNDGNAPFYYPWTAAVRLTQADGSVSVQPLDIALPALLPGQTVQAQVTLPPSGVSVEAGILDPATNLPAVELGMYAPRDGCWYQLLTLDDETGGE